MWKALLAAIAEVTRLQPEAYEWGQPGSGWWTQPHGSHRSEAVYSEDGREVSCTYTVGICGGGEKSYRLSVRLDGGGDDVPSTS